METHIEESQKILRSIFESFVLFYMYDRMQDAKFMIYSNSEMSQHLLVR